jgi:hypothetical protein
LNYSYHGNCESEHGEFDSRGKNSKEQIGYKGEGEGSVIGGIG